MIEPYIIVFLFLPIYIVQDCLRSEWGLGAKAWFPVAYQESKGSKGNSHVIICGFFELVTNFAKIANIFAISAKFAYNS